MNGKCLSEEEVLNNKQHSEKENHNQNGNAKTPGTCLNYSIIYKLITNFVYITW